MKLTFSRITMFTAAMLALAVSFADARVVTERVFMRTSVGASSFPQPTSLWLAPKGNPFYADSSTWRHVAAAINVDTTMAIPITKLTSRGFVPSPTQAGDTTRVWAVLTIWAQNTDGDYDWSGVTTLDSVYLAAQVSIDGNVWIDVDGTPTVNHYVSAGPVSGNVNILTVEQDTGANAATFVLRCLPGLAIGVGDRLIINRNICEWPAGYVRFILTPGVGTGQFAMNISYDDGS